MVRAIVLIVVILVAIYLIGLGLAFLTGPRNRGGFRFGRRRWSPTDTGTAFGAWSGTQDGSHPTDSDNSPDSGNGG